MDRKSLLKLLAVCLLVVGYVFIAAFDFHREAIAPFIVLAVAAIFFLPLKRSESHPEDAESRSS
ncbi:hypothetical protein COCCU_09505 [Corynebacterium occultum]|uniref:Uncharacterized protein n=1 Tax=Corynebacterium occultum TaxID=2675219 RepID=A0A6B8W979_9CORY|nr:hypothetical protein [Corynebacterium occultum]QGU07825.1 hypothetical protein COCCU_09505 [Corynebacterium occultum]